MNRQLPLHPNLTQLRHQAKDLARDADVPLSEAQFRLAREYGFASWPKLKHYVDGIDAHETRVTRLRAEFAAADPGTKRRLLAPAHNTRRFENYNPDAAELSEGDARLLIANEEGYAFAAKYESYLHLHPAVREAIVATRAGDFEGLREILRGDPSAANPHWVGEFTPPKPIPNDSIPLFCVSEGVFRKTNQRGNEYDLVRALLDAGADPVIEADIVLSSPLSFGVIRAAEALLDGGAPIDGVDGDGVPMAYAVHFGYVEIAEMMARRGAKLDLRFASAVGRIDLVKSWFAEDGSLKPGAGALADPYGQERKYHGESPFRCERTRENILSQSLCFACIHGRMEVMDFLLSCGADIDAIVPGLDSKATVLHHAVAMEFPLPAVEFLLDRGANPNIRDGEHHNTPLGWARHFKRDDLMALLAEGGG